LTGGSALDEVEAVLRVREPLYRRASDASFATDEAAPAATVEAVLQWLKAQGHLVGGCSK
jgi:shikimate kinase